jgi:hypothetical protein
LILTLLGLGVEETAPAAALVHESTLTRGRPFVPKEGVLRPRLPLVSEPTSSARNASQETAITSQRDLTRPSAFPEANPQPATWLRCTHAGTRLVS